MNKIRMLLDFLLIPQNHVLRDLRLLTSAPLPIADMQEDARQLIDQAAAAAR
jgi:hypothetical protein